MRGIATAVLIAVILGFSAYTFGLLNQSEPAFTANNLIEISDLSELQN